MANERPRRAVDARLQEKVEKMKHLYIFNQSSLNFISLELELETFT